MIATRMSRGHKAPPELTGNPMRAAAVTSFRTERGDEAKISNLGIREDPPRYRPELSVRC
jgi:hypothetical protein